MPTRWEQFTGSNAYLRDARGKLAEPRIHQCGMTPASTSRMIQLLQVPNRGIKVVRIHWLLNLVTVRPEHAKTPHPLPSSAYDFSLYADPTHRLDLTLACRLDDLLDMVARDHGLVLGFEIMGNPRLGKDSRQGVYSSWKDPKQLQGWTTMVAAIAAHVIERYSAQAVGEWRFEAWNEPNHGATLVMGSFLIRLWHRV